MDEQSQQQFVEQLLRHQDRVYVYLRTILSNRSDAEELFQQTVLVLWKKWGQFEPGRDFMAWACGIAHNEVRNFLRKNERQNLRLSEALVDQLACTYVATCDVLENRRAALAQCIARLPLRDQQLLDRCYMANVNIRDVAQELEQTPRAIYKTLRRLRWSLFQCINRALKAGER